MGKDFKLVIVAIVAISVIIAWLYGAWKLAIVLPCTVLAKTHSFWLTALSAVAIIGYIVLTRIISYVLCKLITQ